VLNLVRIATSISKPMLPMKFFWQQGPQPRPLFSNTRVLVSKRFLTTPVLSKSSNSQSGSTFKTKPLPQSAQTSSTVETDKVKLLTSRHSKKLFAMIFHEHTIFSLINTSIGGPAKSSIRVACFAVSKTSPH
jgi:hypothetical protein